MIVPSVTDFPHSLEERGEVKRECGKVRKYS
jgi:hypothetical protein